MKKIILPFVGAGLLILFYHQNSFAYYAYPLLQYPTATRTTAYAINDNGKIVGEYYDGSSTHGFTLDGGVYTTIDYPSVSLTSFTGINNSGLMAGRMINGSEHGLLFDGNDFTVVDFSGSAGTALRGINDNDVSVGRFWLDGYKGFSYDSGSYVQIDIPNRSENPRDIDNSGNVVGEVEGLTGFFYNGSTFSDIIYPGAWRTDAYGINDAGQIVGYYQQADGQRHGYLYFNGIYTPIDYPGSSATQLFDINNLGQIIGEATVNGKSVSFLMSPVPVPGTIWLLGSSVFVLVGFRRKKKHI